MTQTHSVIFGATSALAQSVCRELGETGETLTLIARNEQKLIAVAADLEARGVKVESIVSDLDDVSAHSDLCDQVKDANSFWFFYGTLPDQQECQMDWEQSHIALNTNFMSVASLLSRLANICEERNAGKMVVVSSVAGDRGRKSNYVYGTAKGALSLFCQGLRNRLHDSNVQLLTVKPGFIDTPMTHDVPKKPAPLWATPDKVASDIVKATSNGKDVLYTPWFWRFIMLIIKSVPEKLFKRLSL